jgi:tetratricopeptide (TPR) repeat protein
MNLKTARSLAVAALMFCAVLFSAIANPRPAAPETSVPAARAWREPLIIPTYIVEPPETAPMFYHGRAYQGAKGPLFPYPLLDRLTDVKKDVAYQGLWLENEFVKICVLPELGGRIFSAVDKTNGYDFFYRQHVVKPALIGMLGAWISAGVEWNIPHHHRPTSFMTVDSSIENRPDGSATVWVGEVELRHRTRWLVGLTLRPGSSVLEVSTRIFNRTPLAHSMLCFANAAVHATEDYQIIFPPTTEVATYHGKNQFSGWPVSHEVFNGVDYTRGVDVSWWKNHPRPTSFFAHDAEGDFLAGYDHGKRAGVAFVADHHVVPGKKLWTWGTGTEGKTWDRILTDEDGPYLELMIGAYSDNQPDYSWIRPHEVKEVVQYWYPIRSLGGVKSATRDAAVALDVNEAGRARLAVNATRAVAGGRVALFSGGAVLFEDTADVAPDRPYEKEVALPAGTKTDDLGLSFAGADGREIVAYRPQPRKNAPLPRPVTPPAAPADIPTVEELYLTGLRLEQFHNPVFEPYPYYEEALRRDPGDARVNTALGLLFLKRGLYGDAEAKFRTALERLTKNYTRPLDGDASYYLGVALRSLDREAEAEDAFFRASWDAAWTAPAYYQIAEIACRRGDFAAARERLEMTLALNGRDTRALGLLSAALRHLDRSAEAAEAASKALAIDPLDVRALDELVASGQTAGRSDEARRAGETLRGLTTDSDANTLELFTDYAAAGFWDEAAAALERRARLDSAVSSPLLYYALAFCRGRQGRPSDVPPLLKLAAAAPRGLPFPFQLEFLEILRWAERENPADAVAPYILGNLLYDLQPEAAIPEWEKSRALDPKFAFVHRNLGLAYARTRGDVRAGYASLEKAMACSPRDARLYYEFDLLAEAAGVPAVRRLAVLEKNHGVVAERDDALGREIGLLVMMGRYGRAIELLRGHHFRVWEGGGDVHPAWVEAHLLRGREALTAGKPAAALRDFETALIYPENFDVSAPSDGGGSPKIFYFIGAAAEASGDRARGAQAFDKAAAFRPGWSEDSYFLGLALRKLGREAEALRTFEGLAGFAQDGLKAAPKTDFFEKFGERQSARVLEARHRLLLGLGRAGQGKSVEAATEFRRALELDPRLLEARLQLEEIGRK